MFALRAKLWSLYLLRHYMVGRGHAFFSRSVWVRVVPKWAISRSFNGCTVGQTSELRFTGIYLQLFEDSLLAIIKYSCIRILQYWSDGLLAMIKCSSCFYQILDRSSVVSALICSRWSHQILYRSSVVSVLNSFVSMV